MAIAFCATANTFAQSTDDYDQKYKVLQARLNRADAKLKEQSANLNKTYNNVTPEVQEDLNNREDSIYLELLSKKRTIELEIAELKKGHTTVVKMTTTTPKVEEQQKVDRRTAVLAGERVAESQKKTAAKNKKRK